MTPQPKVPNENMAWLRIVLTIGIILAAVITFAVRTEGKAETANVRATAAMDAGQQALKQVGEMKETMAEMRGELKTIRQLLERQERRETAPHAQR